MFKKVIYWVYSGHAISVCTESSDGSIIHKQSHSKYCKFACKNCNLVSYYYSSGGKPAVLRKSVLKKKVCKERKYILLDKIRSNIRSVSLKACLFFQLYLIKHNDVFLQEPFLLQKYCFKAFRRNTLLWLINIKQTNGYMK